MRSVARVCDVPASDPISRLFFVVWEGCVAMKRARSYCRALLLAVIATVSSSVASPAVPTSLDDGSFLNDGSLALSPSLRPEVRLRKLHLVRPDLIQYPIAFEVYC
jgi:hypothetical protein